MFYKHWKKIALAVTSFFWVSCDNDPSSASEEPASSSSIEEIKSSAATGSPASSSATESAKSSATADAPTSSSATEGAASSAAQDEPNVKSSTSHEKSSSSNLIAPKYGVPVDSVVVTPKYGVQFYVSSSSEIAAKYGVPMPTCEKVGSTLTCSDGVTCTEVVTEKTQTPECSGDQICAKYGVVVVKDTTYKCDDGNVYNEAEFRSKYEILDGAVDLYGCPSDICGDPDQPKPLYGI